MFAYYVPIAWQDSTPVSDWVSLLDSFSVSIAGLSLRAGAGDFPQLIINYECGPQLLSLENGRKIEPKEIPSSLIPYLLIVFTQQLEVLVTTLQQWPVLAICSLQPSIMTSIGISSTPLVPIVARINLLFNSYSFSFISFRIVTTQTNHCGISRSYSLFFTDYIQKLSKTRRSINFNVTLIL